MVFPPSKATAYWRTMLAPWCRAIRGTLFISRASPIDVAPTRDDLAALTIELSMDHIGRDRGLWVVLFEALELFHLVWHLDARLGWTLLLEACGKAPAQLAFPLTWLDSVQPRYVLRFCERDLLDGFDRVADVFEIVVAGVAEWNHSPRFRDVEVALLNVLDAFDGRVSCIDLACAFEFEDSPPHEVDLRLDCLATIKSFASFLRTYQEPVSPRYWDDSAFHLTSFGLDFSDCYLLTEELSKLAQIMLEIAVSSLTFSAWSKASTPPLLVHNFCHVGVMSATPHAEQNGGLQSLTLYATDVSVYDRFVLTHAIRTSWFLHHVTFFDRGSLTPVTDGWLELILDTLFGDDTEAQVESVQLVLSRTSLHDIAAAQKLLESTYGSRTEGSQRGESARAQKPGSVRTVELVPIDYYSFSVHDVTTLEAFGASTLQQSSAVQRPPGAADGLDIVMMPEPAPHRLSLHPVRSLTISLCADSESCSTTAEVVALVWLVGEPLERLIVTGRTTPEIKMPVLTAIQLEQLLTACPQVVRLELHSLAIESLEPLTDSSLSGNIQSLVIDQCHIHDPTSVLAFYAALGDATHDLYDSLQDLSMCEDDSGDLEVANAALDMLAHNQRLARFVLRAQPTGAALKLRHRFRLFQHQPMADAAAEKVPIGAKTAFLSVLTAVYDQTNGMPAQLVEEVSSRVFAFAGTPVCRYCAVVPV